MDKPMDDLNVPEALNSAPPHLRANETMCACVREDVRGRRKTHQRKADFALDLEPDLQATSYQISLHRERSLKHACMHIGLESISIQT
jgi:hypothetical protein